MADKPTNKERLKELGEKIEAGIREVFDSGKYAEYLKVMSRFPTYSVNNQMLIRLQRPNATKVAGYNKWQQFERHVKRGEHGITIIAPTPYKKKIEEQKLDMDGFFSPTAQRIAIRQGMSEVQTVCACIHEMTHATLHNYEKQRMEAAAGDPSKEPPKPKPHQIEEIEAESTSYMVCQYFGIETGGTASAMWPPTARTGSCRSFGPA